MAQAFHERLAEFEAEPQLKAQKECSPQNRESKANNTGGDGAKILNVCLITRTDKKACEDIAARWF